MPPLPPLTQALILINIAVFALDTLLGGAAGAWLALWPLGTNFQPLQMVTYAFVHAGWMHLLFNMLGLWMFGSELEQLWGRRRYAIFYAACILTAAIAQLVLAPLAGSARPTVGASGAIFGMLLAYAVLFPTRVVMLIIPPVPVKARTLAWIYGLMEVYVMLPAYFPGVGPLNYVLGNTAHLAHLGGMLGAWLTIRYFRGQPPFGRRR
jgi:membrane associated rhomboid family serine protease